MRLKKNRKVGRQQSLELGTCFYSWCYKKLAWRSRSWAWKDSMGLAERAEYPVRGGCVVVYGMICWKQVSIWKSYKPEQRDKLHLRRKGRNGRTEKTKRSWRMGGRPKFEGGYAEERGAENCEAIMVEAGKRQKFSSREVQGFRRGGIEVLTFIREHRAFIMDPGRYNPGHKSSKASGWKRHENKMAPTLSTALDLYLTCLFWFTHPCLGF